MDGEPFQPHEARRRIKAVLANDGLLFTRHSKAEMLADDLQRADIVNILRCGQVEPPEEVRGTWRYRVRTSRMMAVIAFESDQEIIVVTAWRIKT